MSEPSREKTMYDHDRYDDHASGHAEEHFEDHSPIETWALEDFADLFPLEA